MAIEQDIAVEYARELPEALKLESTRWNVEHYEQVIAHYTHWRISMIARIWHGATEGSKSENHLHYLKKTGVPDYKATEGNLGVFVLRRFEDDRAHFLLISLWESPEAIKQFAGAHLEEARYYPEDENYLLELEPIVTHYDVLVHQ